MANIKSAIKRIKITRRNNFQNKLYSSNVKTFTKKYYENLKLLELDRSKENQIRVTQSLSLVFSKIDKAVKRNVLHRNTAARKKSKLTMAFNKIQKV